MCIIYVVVVNGFEIEAITFINIFLNLQQEIPKVRVQLTG